MFSLCDIDVHGTAYFPTMTHSQWASSKTGSLFYYRMSYYAPVHSVVNVLFITLVMSGN